MLAELRNGPTLDELRAIRAIEVLEQIGTPESLALIRELQTGDPGAVLTRETKAVGRN